MKSSGLFLKIVFFLTLMGASFPAQAKVFKNAYISFEILDSWDCVARAPEWICRSSDPQEAKEAAIILTAKEVGPTDRFDLYIAHMNSSQTVQMKNGTTLISRVIYQAQKNLYNNQPWLDGLHQDGEVKNFYTRYLATIKDDIAVLVTFSAHNRYYAKYSAAFMKTIQSLKIIAPKNLISSTRGGGAESFGNPSMTGNPTGLLEGEDSSAGSGSHGGNEKMLGLGILIAAILGYVGYRYYSAKKNS